MMERKERLSRDRGEMARRALIAAGYLTGRETKEDLGKEQFYELAASFLADVFHLARIHGHPLENSQEVVDGISARALGYNSGEA